MNKKLITLMLVLLAAQFCHCDMLGALEGRPDRPDKNKDKDDQKEFKSKFAGKYKPAEESFRVSIFQLNKAKYEAHNRDPANTETMGVTEFSDLTDKEFTSRYLSLKLPKKLNLLSENLQASYTVPTIDWVVKSMVTPVKNQKACGSCWAFAAAGAMESVLLQKGVSSDLSEQELVDCAGDYGNAGCDGGWMGNAFDYIIDNGISSEKEYPYVAKDQTCKVQTKQFKISNYTEGAGCPALADSIAVGPVTVAVDASNWGGYVKGIFSKCGTNLNHGVLVVGSSPTEWRVKNSWGTNWGEKGYIRIKTGNTCGICKYPSRPTL